MTPIIIAGIILAVGAGIELLAYIFACRMDRKRKEGLDRREARLNEREYDLRHQEEAIPHKIEFGTEAWDIVRLSACGVYSVEDMKRSGFPETFIWDRIGDLKLKILDQVYNKITVTREDLGCEIKLYANLPIAVKGGQDDAM